MSEKRIIPPASHASLSSPQIALRKLLSDEDGGKYAVEVLVPPGGRLGPDEELEHSDISLDDENRLFIRHPRTGKWIEIQTGGGITISGVVMEAIHRTPDVTSDPADYAYGKVRVLGDESGALYDCANLYLAETEVAVVGLQLELLGPFRRKNPAYDPENEESDEPEFFAYYLVQKWSGIYETKLENDLIFDETSTVKVSDIISGGQSYEFDVVDAVLSSGEKYEAGDAVTVKNSEVGYGEKKKRVLLVIDGPCAKDQEDELDPDPEPE